MTGQVLGVDGGLDAVNLLHPGARVIDAVDRRDADRGQDRGGGRRAGRRDRWVVFLPIATTVASIARYLAAFRLGRPVVLLDPEADHADLIARFTAPRSTPTWPYC